jgi:hypothetical protein
MGDDTAMGGGERRKPRCRVNGTGSVYDNVKNGDSLWLVGHVVG